MFYLNILKEPKQPMSETVMRRMAKPMLFIAAFIWGSSFFIMKGAVDSIPVFFLLAIRFTGGAALLALICWKKWKNLTGDYVWRGAVMGALLFLAYSVQTFGLAGTTPSKNAFLTAVYCVIVPFLYWLVAKKRPDKFNIMAAVLCVAGVGFVSLNGDFSITWGDALTLCCAIFYASHIVAVAKVSPGKDIYLLTVFQFAFAALFAWILGFLFQELPPLSIFNTDMVVQLLYLTVMATTVALLFQNVGQFWSEPSSAAVILSLESVFGVLCSVIFYGDPVSLQLVVGFVLIFLAVICSETKFSFLRKKPVPEPSEG